MSCETLVKIHYVFLFKLFQFVRNANLNFIVSQNFWSYCDENAKHYGTKRLLNGFILYIALQNANITISEISLSSIHYDQFKGSGSFTSRSSANYHIYTVRKYMYLYRHQ